MPTYQYECTSCEYSFEELQSMTEKKLTDCPECGEPKLARLIGTGGGIIFKGSGFYETDYKKKDSPKSEPSGTSTAPAKTESSGETVKKAEEKTKPEPKVGSEAS